MDSPIMAPPSPLLDAAIAILADGKPRSADEILAEGQRRGLFDAGQTRKHIYTALSQYVQRTLGRGRKPDIVEDAERRFRLNRPVDDWLDIDTTGLPPLAISAALPPSAAAVVGALQSAAGGLDPLAFELAVRDLIALLGFAAKHIGGNDAPDNIADALLGPLAYRATVECKLGRDDTISQSDAVAETAKFRDPYHADYCMLVAPSFDAEVTFVSELHMHGVSAWTVDDLIRAATLRLDCSQLRSLFAPGYAADALDDLAWAEIHGPAKRLRVVASLLVEIGLAQQKMEQGLSEPSAVASLSNRDSIPLLTRDVALSFIDDRLSGAGSTRGVTRDEVDAAFTWLTSPYVGRAIWADDAHTAIVIRPALPP
jgi:hypothetical protein